MSFEDWNYNDKKLKKNQKYMSNCDMGFPGRKSNGLMMRFQ